MIKKNPKKTKNPTLVTEYKKEFPHCEACAYLEGVYPVREIQTHHIFGGNLRTDEIWDLINVCPPHHDRGTTHHLKYGSNAKEMNKQYLAIKFIKEEISIDKLEELGVCEDVLSYAGEIMDSENYKKICNLHGFATDEHF